MSSSEHPPQPLISFSKVTCGYKEKIVFKDLSLMLFPRQFAGLVGPSGAGKSTLLKAILGISPILSGNITFAGKQVNGSVPPDVGYVPQIETVDWDFPVTVEQVVAMGLYRKSTRLPWLTGGERSVIRELLDRLNIGHYAERQIKLLSGGEQQRVFLARALVANPKLLILDEPTSGVDVKTQHAILHLLGEINRKGVTILLTTHDLNAVARHLPWVICFNQKVVAQGDPDEVFTSEVLSRTYQSDMAVFRQGDVMMVDDSPKAGHHFAKHVHGADSQDYGHHHTSHESHGHHESNEERHRH